MVASSASCRKHGERLRQPRPRRGHQHLESGEGSCLSAGLVALEGLYEEGSELEDAGFSLIWGKIRRGEKCDTLGLALYIS